MKMYYKKLLQCFSTYNCEKYIYIHEIFFRKILQSNFDVRYVVKKKTAQINGRGGKYIIYIF